MARSTQSPFGDEGHEESREDYHRRVQDQMDEDSWIGRSTVSADFPERAIVHDITPPDEQEPPHIYRVKRRG